MSENFNKDRYESIAIEFNQCLEWFKSFGLKINITRLYKYKKDLNLLIDAYNSRTTEDLIKKEKFADISNAFYEIREILDIYSGLKKIELNEELKKRLKRYIEGPDKINEEKSSSSSNNPRDIGLELFIGSRFLCSGCDVSFKEDGDLEFIFEDRNIYVECKRPTNINRVKENINKAFKQLEKKYKNDTEARGIISISINKIINTKNHLLVASDISNLSEAMDKKIEYFIRVYEKFWQKNRDKRTVGIIVLFQAQCISKEDNMLIIGRKMGLNNTTVAGGDDYKLLIRITENVKNSF